MYMSVCVCIYIYSLLMLQKEEERNSGEKDMYKNQLQELAQRSCFNLPCYSCIREGPDHAPRFKACVNFNGEIFESPCYSTTLRQAEHAAAQVALASLSTRGPSRSLTARVLDETGVYKNLLQETAHRAGLKLPVYTTVRSGPGHMPVFTCTVELAGTNFTGESAKTKKQAEKNAAIVAWSALKKMPELGSPSLPTTKETGKREAWDEATSSSRRRDQIQNNNQARRRMLRECPEFQKWGLLMNLPVDSPASTPKLHKIFASPPHLPIPPPPAAHNLMSMKIMTGASSSSSLDHEQQRDFGDNEKSKIEMELLEGLAKSIAAMNILNHHHPAADNRFLQPNSDGKNNNNIKPVVQKQSRDDQIKTCSGSRKLGSISSGCHQMTIPPPINSHVTRRLQRLAPAVQIRSAIPVCAAPPESPMKLSPQKEQEQQQQQEEGRDSEAAKQTSASSIIVGAEAGGLSELKRPQLQPTGNPQLNSSATSSSSTFKE